ncbi:MAG: shikimate dehydrogenase [Paludibacteraceae bacterium]|nr:shikimate dehydrogenase [Paludibacteraceae bacterium]
MPTNSTYTNNYGLIGYPLEHSFSAAYFQEKFLRENINATYRSYEIEDLNTLPKLIEKENIKGLSVTLPYKEQIFRFLNFIDPVAKQIGAVNTIKITDDKKIIGYNTDYIGFMQSIMPLIDLNSPHQALVFGSGGASKAVQYALRKMQIRYKIVRRKHIDIEADKLQYCADTLTYNELTEQIIKEHNILINATPVGMYPNINDCLTIPYNGITNRHILFDLIYNPSETCFLRQGRERDAKTQNGLQMLQMQAEQAWLIFTDNSHNFNNLIKL